MGGHPIQVENVSYFFGKGELRKQILFEVSTEIAAGEIVILTGPSGSGKTTLLTLIGALRSCHEGVVKVLDNNLSAASEHELVKVRRRIGYIFQQHNLLESLSVAENIQMALELGGERSRKGWNERIEKVLDQVGMVEHMFKKPAELSGGPRRRLRGGHYRLSPAACELGLGLLRSRAGGRIMSNFRAGSLRWTTAHATARRAIT